MPKVIEVLARNQVADQVWFSARPVREEDLPSPPHMEKGVRQSPFQKDNFYTREPE